MTFSFASGHLNILLTGAYFAKLQSPEELKSFAVDAEIGAYSGLISDPKA